VRAGLAPQANAGGTFTGLLWTVRNHCMFVSHSPQALAWGLARREYLVNRFNGFLTQAQTTIRQLEDR